MNDQNRPIQNCTPFFNQFKFSLTMSRWTPAQKPSITDAKENPNGLQLRLFCTILRFFMSSTNSNMLHHHQKVHIPKNDCLMGATFSLNFVDADDSWREAFSSSWDITISSTLRTLLHQLFLTPSEQQTSFHSPEHESWMWNRHVLDSSNWSKTNKTWSTVGLRCSLVCN